MPFGQYCPRTTLRIAAQFGQAQGAFIVQAGAHGVGRSLSIQIQQAVDQRPLLLRELRVIELSDIFEHTPNRHLP